MCTHLELDEGYMKQVGGGGDTLLWVFGGGGDPIRSPRGGGSVRGGG
jgi:hypothetical protein